MPAAADLVARPIAGLLPVEDVRGPLRVVIASLVPGGAERIVIEWLAAESARGRAVELAVLYRTKDGRLNMPDIFRVGFGIRRKGGVRPPR